MSPSDSCIYRTQALYKALSEHFRAAGYGALSSGILIGAVGQLSDKIFDGHYVSTNLQELGRLLARQRAATSRIINKLHRAGVIEKERHGAYGLRIRFCLAWDGEKIVNTSRQHHRGVESTGPALVVTPSQDEPSS